MDKETIRQAVLRLGADVCGFAAVERFFDAPEGCRPTDILAGCKSVIVYGVALPRGLYAVPPAYIYAHFNGSVSVSAVDDIGFRLARLLESDGGLAVPLPCDGPVAYYDEATRTKRGLLSMRHAAVQAGLGALGKNALLLNGRFGNRLTIGAALTDVAFPSDPYAEPICIESCRICLDNCPAQAISDGRVTQAPCRENTFVPDALGYATIQCNRCRAKCPMWDGKRQ